MMVQDIENPEYILQRHDDNDDECDNDDHPPPQCWAERTPIYLVPYPQANTNLVRAKMPAMTTAGVVADQHRDKRPKLPSSEEVKTRNSHRRHGNRRQHADPRADNHDKNSGHRPAASVMTTTIRAHFYFDQYPSESAQERLKINELVDVVAVRVLSSSSPASTSSRRTTSDTWPDDNEDAIDDDGDEAMEDQDGMARGEIGMVTQEQDDPDFYSNNNETAQDGEWHVLWYRRRSLYDGIINAATTTTPHVPPPPVPSQRPDFGQASLADQALALLLHSRTEKRTAPGPAFDPHSKRVGCAMLRWIVRDVHQRDALLRALPAPYTIMHSHEVVMTTMTVDDEQMLTPQMLTPRRDPNTGRLRHSPLQLPAGALLVLDLTDIAGPGAAVNTAAAGATTSIGLNSAVRNVLATHRLDYCFDGGVKIPFEADYRILVITTPHLHCNDFLPPDSTFTIEAPPPSDLFGSQQSQGRLVVTTGLPRLSERVELPGSLLESVVQAYAAFSSTTTGQKKSEDLLHRWLIATRSIARYHGHSTATLADFAMACRVEDQLQASVVLVK
jgi:hypothetical protein